MIKVAKVKIWNNVVGAIAWNENTETATFEYDKSFLKSGLDIAPLTMPLEKAFESKNLFSFPALNKETYKGLPGLLADSLPDAFGNKIIDSWLAQQGRDPNSFNAIERLCYTGKRGMGALEYEPILSPIEESSKSLELKELVSLAKNILNARQPFLSSGL